MLNQFFQALRFAFGKLALCATAVRSLHSESNKTKEKLCETGFVTGLFYQKNRGSCNNLSYCFKIVTKM